MIPKANSKEMTASFIKIRFTVFDMENEEIDLEQILNILSSDEARNSAICQLVGKVNLPRSLVERAVQVYEQAGRFNEAADVALKAGMKERAEGLYQRVVENHEKAGLFKDAAYVALKAGMTERAVQDYEKAGRFNEAADVALKAGMKERAEQLKILVNLIDSNSL